MEWNSEQYLKFERQRTQPSIDLINRIDIKNPKSIIDIGCGPGNSAKTLAEFFPDANIIGVDNSKNMLEKAKNNYPEIEFMFCDVGKNISSLSQKFDIVFSNACIHWIPNHYVLLKNMMNILNDNGVLAVQVPLQNTPAHKIIDSTVNSEKWKNKFDFEEIFHNLTTAEYVDILTEISSDYSIWETTYYHIMPSHKAILEWVKGTTLKPYLSVLSKEECIALEEEILEEFTKVYPMQKNGEITFKFPRLFYTALKK